MSRTSWDFLSIPPQRVKAAKSTHLLAVDRKNETATFLSSDKETVYHTSLTGCECVYYCTHGDPCKHVVRLAMELGVLNSNGVPPEEQDRRDCAAYRDKLALAFGYKHLFGEPTMSDEEFNSLYREYNDFLASHPSLYAK